MAFRVDAGSHCEWLLHHGAAEAAADGGDVGDSHHLVMQLWPYGE